MPNKTTAVLSLSLAVGILQSAWGQQTLIETLRVDAGRIENRIEALARFGRNRDGGVDRIAFSAADIAGREYIMGLMRGAELDVRIDAAGNIIGRREGGEPQAPVIMFGSHIDSVPNGGNYDGDVGVIGAIEVIEVLRQNAIETRHPLEVVVFANEEGGLIGSRALIGELDRATLDVVSHSGLTVREGIEAIGGNPSQLRLARYEAEDLLAFIELHIEQGATLYEEKIDIGVVEGIVGIRWWDVTVEGFANHAGTTPMDRRRDALLAGAEFVLAVNRIVTAEPGRQVGTVGRISAEPGAPNVIPGKVVMSLELRDLSEQTMDSLYSAIEAEAKSIAERSGTRISLKPIDVTVEPAPTDERIRRVIASAARGLGLSYRLMPSGAGHDAQDMARITPTGMIFVPSVDGISHSPKELTRRADMENGANVLLQTVLRLDRDGVGD